MRLLILLLLATNLTFGQNFDSIQIDTALKSFHNTKSIALHINTNKTTYISNEEIWFSLYAFELENNKITSNNLNVVVQLIDKENTVISKSLLYLENGTVNGKFVLDLKIKSNIYYLHAFIINELHDKNEEYITKPIRITNPNNKEKENTIANINQVLDIQILPEGGHLLTDVNNNCGIKILNSHGKGVELNKITLKDSKGKTVKENISTNHLGMGKFSFTPSKNNSYFISLDEYTKELPPVENFGIALNLKQNFKSGDLELELTTNQNSLSLLNDKNITILFHKESLSFSYKIKFLKNYPKITLNIPNKDLFTGVNTITVFNNDLRPILERVFFNFKSIKSNQSLINQISNVKDTFSYKIINTENNLPIITKTSISVLPINTIANKNRGHVYASTYLSPYIKGQLEKPSYYFEDNNIKKLFEIDLLLLNQGWSKYKWANIFNGYKKTFKPIEPGITISGYVVPLDKSKIPKSILLFSKDSKVIKMINLDSENKFKIKNLAFEKGSNFELSVIDQEEKTIKANFFITTTPSTKHIERNGKFFEKEKTPTNNEENAKPLLITQGEILNEVIINSNKLKFEKFTRGRFGIKVDSSLYGYTTIANYFKATETLRLKFSEGSIYDPPGFYFFYIDGTKAAFYVDGQKATYSNGLLDIPMEYVEELYHGGKDGYGRRMSNLIYTNGKKRELPEHLKTAKKFSIENGFSFQKEVYKPKYIDYESESYQKYGAIDWKTDVISNSIKENVITLINPGHHDLLFFIEGFTEDGRPFSTTTQYRLPKNN